MLLSTLVPAIILVAFMYISLSRLFRWRWLSYGLALTIAGLLAATHTVHLSLTGIEVAGLGCLVTWLDPLGYWKKKL